MLAAAADERTLIEDWIVRRQRLSAQAAVPGQHRLMQLQVLNYLIGRYAESPEAARPARFASPAAFSSNDRLIVVHHHLGRGKIAGVKDRAEATRRVGDILRHLRRVHDEEPDAVTPHNDFASWVDELDQQPEIPSIWQDIRRQLRLGPQPSINATISAALAKGPYLPRALLAYLCRCSSTKYDTVAADLLLKCRSDSVPEYVASAWRERVNKGFFDAITLRLRSYLASQPGALDGVRAQFAHANPRVRLAAIDLLRAGTLDDVAFLSDLVSLPRDPDEDPQERRALLGAMWELAHRD